MRKLMNKSEVRKFLLRLYLAILIIISYKIIMNLPETINGLSAFFKILTPFFYGFILAYLLNIPCSSIEKKFKKSRYKFFSNRSRGISVLMVYTLFVLIIVLAMNVIIPILQSNLTDFIQNFSSYYNKAYSFLKDLPLENYGISSDWVDDVFAKVTWRDLLEGIGLKDILSSLNVVFGLTSYIFNLFLTVVSSIYFLLEVDNVKSYAKHLINLFLTEKRRAVVIRYSHIVNDSFRKYIVCQLLDSCILGSITTIEFMLLGSDYALALGVMLAVFNIIPYFGSIFGSIVAVIVMALTNGIGNAAITAVVLLITQQTDGNIIQPRLMGTSFSLSPALIIIGITVGGAAGGIWGMIIAIPIVNILKSILNDIVAHKEASLKLAAEAAGESAGEASGENSRQTEL